MGIKHLRCKYYNLLCMWCVRNGKIKIPPDVRKDIKYMFEFIRWKLRYLDEVEHEIPESEVRDVRLKVYRLEKILQQYIEEK